MKKRTVVAAAAIAIAAVFVTMLLIVRAGDTKYTTYTANLYDAEMSVPVTGVFVRSEARLQLSAGGSVVYLLSDGDRTANKEEIARVYSSAQSVEAARRIALLSDELADLETLSASAQSGAVLTPGTVLSRTKEVLDGIDAAVKNGGARGIYEQRRTLTQLLNQYGSYFEEKDYSARIAELTQEINSLKNEMGNYTSQYSPDSGYFFYYSDGLEGLSPAQLSELSCDKVDALIAQTENAKNAAQPKLVTDYTWYFVFNMPTPKAIQMSGSKLQIRFPAVSDEPVETVIETMQKDGSTDGNTAVRVSSRNAIAQLGECRTEQAEILIRSEKGLRIPVSAIRTVTNEDGTEQAGVYAVVGPEMRFRKINVLSSDGEYAVCEYTNIGVSGWLQIYDEVIVKGKDLADGKKL
ncbi:MAG TPA: HlyD family efflux transporter periplasmic adaptor subunit [Oscillospiraceae bacterium]|nr:HlyD family efflux transporter periplasmic adaptor subunit [Oscillospiraceae bacterium]HPS35038.1 HlyD family efflux transporter periplasmic adaptor subunit [Oscillospiraceae bacterium]